MTGGRRAATGPCGAGTAPARRLAPLPAPLAPGEHRCVLRHGRRGARCAQELAEGARLGGQPRSVAVLDHPAAVEHRDGVAPPTVVTAGAR